jgi:hypothetical protein
MRGKETSRCADGEEVRLPLRAKRTTHNNARAGGGWVGGEKGMTGMMNGALPAKALCGRFAGALRASLRGGGMSRSGIENQNPPCWRFGMASP